MDKKELTELCFLASAVVADPDGLPRFTSDALGEKSSPVFKRAVEVLQHELSSSDPTQARDLLLGSSDEAQRAVGSALRWALSAKR